MSHFFTIVILPKDIEPSKSYKEIEKLMSPYDEQITVAPYMRTCWCLNRIAMRETEKLADVRFGTMNEIRDKFRKLLQEKFPIKTDSFIPEKNDSKEEIERKQRLLEDRWDFEDKQWQAFHPAQDRFTFVEEHVTKHPMYKKPDPKCEECKGTGEYESTYNPKSRWDWWVVGGRWDGVIQENPRDDGKGGFNFGPNHHQPKYNTTLIEATKITDEMVPYAIVTPDGSWHERGKMGLFGMASNEEPVETWKVKAKEILKGYNGHYAVGVDCHI